MNRLEKAAIVIFSECMGLRNDESCLVVFDRNTKNIGEIILKKAKSLCSNSSSMETPVARANGEEPPKLVSEELKKRDVALLLTTKSLSHTKARREATKKGVRIASMPGATKEMIERTLTADSGKMRKTNQKIFNILKKAEKISLKTRKGTDATFYTNPAFNDSGVYTKKGAFGNLPAGEVGFAPRENLTEGTVIIDKTMAGIGKLKNPIEIKIKAGFAVEITGKEEARRLNSILAGFENRAVFNVAEFAIGTNDKAIISGITLEDEKVAGTVHIALGDNTSYSGGNIRAPTHLDGVISKPTVLADGRMIIKDGKFLI